MTKIMPDWHIYLIRCRDGSLYTGITTDVDRRVKRHNAGLGAAYTRSRLPVTLVWQELAESESAARKREAQIKSWTKPEKEKLVESGG